MNPRRALLAALAACCIPCAAERWTLNYFYDEDDSGLTLTDIAFPSARRGVAIGVITGKSRTRPVALVTADGGKNWSQVALHEPGVSLFFLNESLGWMVTPKGVWLTEETGRSWRNLGGPDGLTRVYFRDATHGWAVGIKKQLYSTEDGGRTWTRITLEGEVKSKAESTHFGWIDFANPDVGLIVGWHRPPRRDEPRLPAWLDPESAERNKLLPSVGILVDTHDGGKTWVPSTTSIFGRISRVRLSPEGWGVGLIEFEESFQYTSEVMFIQWRTGASGSFYRGTDRRITDLAIAGPKGPIYLAGVEHRGRLNQSPIPQKVVILRSFDGKTVSSIDVDYRAVARRVILAAPGAGVLWAATDTGQILNLQP